MANNKNTADLNGCYFNIVSKQVRSPHFFLDGATKALTLRQSSSSINQFLKINPAIWAL